MSKVTFSATDIGYEVTENWNIYIKKIFNKGTYDECGINLAEYNYSTKELIFREIAPEHCTLISEHRVSNLDFPSDINLNINSVKYGFEAYDKSKSFLIDGAFGINPIDDLNMNFDHENMQIILY